MASDNHRLMRRGMIVVLTAVGLFAVGAFLPYYGRLSALLMPLKHLLFIAGCVLCWRATPDRRVRPLVAASGISMALAWLLAFYLFGNLHVSREDFPWHWIMATQGLRWVACGTFGWFVFARENALAGFAVAPGTAKLAYAVVALGVFILIGGYFRFFEPFSRVEPVGFFLVLALLAAIIGTRLSGGIPAGGLRDFGDVAFDPAAAAGVEDEPWRARLLASIRDCGIQRAPCDRIFQWVVTIAVLGAIFIITAIGRAAISSGMEGDPPLVRSIAILLWVAFNLFVLVRIRNKFLRKAWQTSARSAEEELERAGSRRPILYLRSFQLDDRIGRPGRLERFLGTVPIENAEQMLTKTLRKVGPVIALGRPEEKLPALGAARFYVTHDRWQAKVRDFADESQLIVWATGLTESLRWEVSHLIQGVPPERLLLWAHPHLLRLGPAEREAEWQRFREQLGGEFPQPLPEKLGDARFITFGPNWEPRPVAPPYKNLRWSLRSLFGPQRSALRAILAVRGKAVGRPWLTPRREGLGIAGAWLLLAAIVAMLASAFFGDGVYTYMNNGKAEYTGYKTLSGDSQVFRLLATLALSALTISMLWGRSILWQRVRAAAILGLAILACIIGVFVLREMAHQEPALTTQAMNAATGEVVVTESVRYVNAIAWGGYLNFALSGLVAFLAAKNAMAVWRRKPSTDAVQPTLLLREEDILYHGPRETHSFAEVIGAAGATIDWRRVGGFFAACSVSAVLRSGSLPWPLMGALATTAAAVVAFHFVRRPIVAALIAAAGSALITGYIFQQGAFPEAFASNAALLAVLVWATPRIAPLSLALGLGALIGAAVQWILDARAYSESQSASSIVLAILGAALFTTCLLVVFQRTPSQAT